jgi:hypothetical protein
MKECSDFTDLSIVVCCRLSLARGMFCQARSEVNYVSHNQGIHIGSLFQLLREAMRYTDLRPYDGVDLRYRHTEADPDMGLAIVSSVTWRHTDEHEDRGTR